MSTTELGQTIAFASYVFRLFKAYWGALQARRERARLRTVLSDMSDAELRDLGITPGEIDYVASNRSIDPRR
jgi:uncharacterized protein YjiS (DUF1127 family)